MINNKTNNLVSTATVNSENKYAEFTTFFRIPFNNVDPATIFTGNRDLWRKVLSAWFEVCACVGITYGCMCFHAI